MHRQEFHSVRTQLEICLLFERHCLVDNNIPFVVRILLGTRVYFSLRSKR